MRRVRWPAVALARIPWVRRRLVLPAVAACPGAARAAGEGVARGAAGGLDPRGAAAPHRVPHGRAGRAARARVAVPGAAPLSRPLAGDCPRCIQPVRAAAERACIAVAAPAAHPSLQSRASAAELAPARIRRAAQPPCTPERFWRSAAPARRLLLSPRAAGARARP